MVFIRGPCLAHTFESAAAQDEDETWAMTYQKKKELFGSGNRVKVGGEKPEGDSETISGLVVDCVFLGDGKLVAIHKLDHVRAPIPSD